MGPIRARIPISGLALTAEIADLPERNAQARATCAPASDRGGTRRNPRQAAGGRRRGAPPAALGRLRGARFRPAPLLPGADNLGNLLAGLLTPDQRRLRAGAPLGAPSRLDAGAALPVPFLMIALVRGSNESPIAAYSPGGPPSGLLVRPLRDPSPAADLRRLRRGHLRGPLARPRAEPAIPRPKRSPHCSGW